MIFFAFSDNLSAENSKLSADSGIQRIQLLECMCGLCELCESDAHRCASAKNGAWPTLVETDYVWRTFSGAPYRKKLLAEQITNKWDLDCQSFSRQDSLAGAVVAWPKAKVEVLDAVQDSFASKFPANL